uniref:Uncharacterized protein AlNc14C102G6069 n=1 Tax=Albugo laibachii Nc14 TaxID=890382 RepID=F0WHN2_9STRA|nr:conserved hypothetical protein [Albugo laibachii Nc14]|eukprot:CCA20725.1 conserved hypothetical protein [Albugo laibachii Nc14]
MSSIFRRFRLALEGTIPSRRRQEEVDTGWVALLTEFRKLSEAKHSKQAKRILVLDELLTEASDLIKKKSFKEQKAQIQAEISARLEEIFKSYSSRPMHWDSVGSNKAKLSISGFSRKHFIDEDILENDLLGFRLSVEQSNLDKAGDGVKVYGKVPPGSLVALYPGTVYLPEHYKKARDT